MRNLTKFNGWANEIDYLAWEAERQKADEQAIKDFQQAHVKLHRKREELRPVELKLRWTLIGGVLCLALAGYLFVVLFMSL